MNVRAPRGPSVSYPSNPPGWGIDKSTAPGWFAEFQDDAGTWHRVLNRDEKPLLYMTEAYALAAAKYVGETA